MLRIPFLIIFKLLYLGSFPNQIATMYFDKNWQPTTEKQDIYFYTPMPEKVGDKYLFRDYYKSGKLYFEALSLSKTDRKFDGLAKFYAENGQLIEVATLKNGLINGEVNSFDETGKVKGKALYLNNEQVNAFMIYYKGDEEGSTDYDTAIKSKGGDMEYVIDFDGDIKGIRQETYFDNKIMKSYDKNGKLIGTAKLDIGYDPIEGTAVKYLYKPMRVKSITHLKKGSKPIRVKRISH
ncbi:hypothetical protein [Pedobacter nototheniae]|uniref:hypothetical protein n=1 Tax=Pedobacter nototheniae TaxID=2488994 RepID=UPI00292EA20C|nr:hypothetical protein [Pedobacter nototheniae]